MQWLDNLNNKSQLNEKENKIRVEDFSSNIWMVGRCFYISTVFLRFYDKSILNLKNLYQTQNL